MRLYHLHGAAPMRIFCKFPSFFCSRNRIILVKLTCFLIFAVLLQAGCETKRRTQPRDLTTVATLAGRNREFGEPFGMASKDGLIYVSDGLNGKILTVSANGTIATFAEGLDTPSGIAFGKNG